jgi:hypothetical protein
MDRELSMRIPIDHHHDYYTITLEDNPDDYYTAVDIELWSRGSFKVLINLTHKDARAFAHALLEATKELPE